MRSAVAAIPRNRPTRAGGLSRWTGSAAGERLQSGGCPPPRFPLSASGRRVESAPRPPSLPRLRFRPYSSHRRTPRGARCFRRRAIPRGSANSGREGQAEEEGWDEHDQEDAEVFQAGEQSERLRNRIEQPFDLPETIDEARIERHGAGNRQPDSCLARREPEQRLFVRSAIDWPRPSRAPAR